MVPYAKPGELADDAENDKWDIGLIGAEPARAEKIDFTAAYVEIEATYLVPAGSPIKSIAEVDVKGNRIAVTARSAYDLWLERNIHNATLHRGNSQAAVDRNVPQGKDGGSGRPASGTDRRSGENPGLAHSGRSVHAPCSRRSARRKRTRPARRG